MFIAHSKKGSGFLNALILFAIVCAAVIVVVSFVKLKKDTNPKNPDGFKTALGFSSRKKVPATV